jgi:hypothetical protein
MFNASHKQDIILSYRKNPEQFFKSYRPDAVLYREKMESSFSGTFSNVQDQLNSRVQHRRESVTSNERKQLKVK